MMAIVHSGCLQEHVHDGNCLLDSVSAHSGTAHLRRKGLRSAVLLRHRSLGLALALACVASVSALGAEVALRTSFAVALKVEHVVLHQDFLRPI